MPTTPPEAAPQQATDARKGRPPDQEGKSWWSSPWVPLGPAVAGLALSLGFHVTLRLWEQTKTYEPLDLSPPFAAKPLPGTSLDNLTRRYGSQLPPLLTPPPQPDGFAPPPPPVPTPNVAVGATADPGPGENPLAQQRTTLAVPPLPRRAPPAPAEPGAAGIVIPLPPPSFGGPQIPSPPPGNLTP